MLTEVGVEVNIHHLMELAERYLVQWCTHPCATYIQHISLLYNYLSLFKTYRQHEHAEKQAISQP